MNQRIAIILSISFVFVLFQSFKNEFRENTEQAVVSFPSDTAQGYEIFIEEIDSLHFSSAKVNSKYIADDFIKITDFNEAKKLLENLAEFDEEDSEYPVVSKLRDRENVDFVIDDYYAFVAYYPEEDILLCEGGHTTDVSFNLKNGEGTEQTGNPDIIKSSQNKKYRLNGHFGGQQCSAYFIQKRFEEGFKKVIQLDEAFEKITNIWLCVIGDSFWVDDNVLYLTEDSSYGSDTKYFKIEIIEE